MTFHCILFVLRMYARMRIYVMSLYRLAIAIASYIYQKRAVLPKVYAVCCQTPFLQALIIKYR